jgi:hypothetical protein
MPLVRCTNCGAEGHVAWTCPKTKTDHPGAGAKLARPPANREATVVSSEAAQSRGRKTPSRTVGSIPATGAITGTIAPPGTCPWCDARRAVNTKTARARRAKEKEPT